MSGGKGHWGPPWRLATSQGGDAGRWSSHWHLWKVNTGKTGFPEVRSQMFLPAHLLSTHHVPPEEEQWAE